MFQNFNLRHTGVTCLTISIVCAYVDTRDVQAAAKIVHLYPSVTKFKMSVGHGARNFEHLKEMLNSFGEWNLSMGKIVMSSFMRAEHVAAVLEGMAGWRGKGFCFR